LNIKNYYNINTNNIKEIKDKTNKIGKILPNSNMNSSQSNSCPSNANLNLQNNGNGIGMGNLNCNGSTSNRSYKYHESEPFNSSLFNSSEDEVNPLNINKRLVGLGLSIVSDNKSHDNIEGDTLRRNFTQASELIKESKNYEINDSVLVNSFQGSNTSMIEIPQIIPKNNISFGNIFNNNITNNINININLNNNSQMYKSFDKFSGKINLQAISNNAKSINLNHSQIIKKLHNLNNYQIEENSSNLNHNVNNNHIMNKRNTIFSADKINKYKIKNVSILEFQNLVSLVKVVFNSNNNSNNLKPWECYMVDRMEFSDIFKDYEKRKNLVNISKESFLSIASESNFNEKGSNNFDQVKTWLSGFQFAPINIYSSEEDSIFINKTFFKFNRNLGYVLKPDFLRDKNKIYNRDYSQFFYTLRIDVISFLFLKNCEKIFNKNDKIYFESYLIGSYEDNNFNLKYKSKTYQSNLIKVLFDCESMKFNIYENEINFLIIKIFLGNSLIARACLPIKQIKNGIRVIKLEDLNYNEYEESVLMVRISMKDFTNNN
jgi:hypothetical protein